MSVAQVAPASAAAASADGTKCAFWCDSVPEDNTEEFDECSECSDDAMMEGPGDSETDEEDEDEEGPLMELEEVNPAGRRLSQWSHHGMPRHNMHHSTHHQAAMKHVADTATTAGALTGAIVDSHHKAMESHHKAFEKHVTDTVANISASVIQSLPPDVAADVITQYAVSEDGRDEEPDFAYLSMLLIL